MLRTLSIRDFVIVDSIELEFSAGFTVFTGETGAGKSILIDALTLALGGRGDASVVREGAAKADITADFAVSDQARDWLAANEFSVEEGGALLRRVIDNAGRSKAYINGIAATASQLRELGDMLVDIHGQHAHQSLMKTEAQRVLLDGQAGAGADVKAVAAAHKAWRALAKQLQEFETNAANVLYERERLEWQVNELEKLAVKPGEWAEVTNEQSRLSHAASLLEGAQEALAALSESEDHPILSQLSSLNQKLGKLANIDTGLQAIVDLIEPARIQLQEAVYAINDYLDRVDLDPERLRQVESRMEAPFGRAQVPRDRGRTAAGARETGRAPDANRRRQRHRGPAQARGKTQGGLYGRRGAPERHAGAGRAPAGRGRHQGDAGIEHDGRAFRGRAQPRRTERPWSGAGRVPGGRPCRRGRAAAGQGGVGRRAGAHFAGHFRHHLQRHHHADPDL
jgi:hypothetical protein